MASVPLVTMVSSEVDMDQSIKTQIAFAIERFTGDHVECDDKYDDILLDNMYFPPTLSGYQCTEFEEMNVQICEYENEISQLEEDIIMLNDELSEHSEDNIPDNDIDQALQILAQSHKLHCITDVSSNDNSKVNKNLNFQVKLNEALTGVTFFSASWRVPNKDHAQLHREYQYTGIACGQSFSIQYTLLETMDSPSDKKDSSSKTVMKNSCEIRRVKGLAAVVDHIFQPVLCSFLDRLKDVMIFFQVFVKYSCLHSEREKIILDSQKKFPQNIVLCESELNCSRVIIVKSRKGREFIIKWFLYVKQNGDIETKLTLEKNHDRFLSGLMQNLSIKNDCKMIYSKLIDSIFLD